ncbi:adenosylhomocysteine nucleosidase [Dongia mobilis]|uniref:Adenosylhomocysteine nucleosidase n=1 Tax=Dongia mobilis TaxID=578943 RepID=A0A4R6WGZ9_9PROT|nr:phosphorylase [Dongia mobilis]TDQ77545.1 adenosylhomocysteine nucleosidase [Dongia mobilis]
MKLGIVTGMVSEARLLDGVDGIVVSGGGHADATLAKIDALVGSGVTHLASFGIAGALDPALGPGDLLIGAEIVLPDKTRLAADNAWVARAATALPQGRVARIAGASHAVASVADKKALYDTTGAAAIDMESHHVAAAARRHNLPFIVIRAIADTAVDALPQAALVGLNKEGRPAIGAVLLSLLRNPFQLPALLRVARRSDIALKTLLGGRAGLL